MPVSIARLALIVASIFIVAVFGCGGSDRAESIAAEPTAIPTATPAPAETATLAAAATPSSTVVVNLDLQVDSTAYLPDANPGDGLCDAGSGNCTLLAAIQEANANSGHDLVTVPEGVYALGDKSGSVVTDAAAALVIEDALTLDGAGDLTILDGQGITGIVLIRPDVPVRIGHMQLRNGFSDAQGAGGIWNEGELWLQSVTVTTSKGSIVGGIFNRGGLQMNDSVVAANVGGCSGGIRNVGRLEIVDGLIENNGAPETGWGGGIDNKHGGIVSIISSTIAGNSARVGGGVLNDGGEMTIVDSVITGNAAPVWGGGGILNDAGGTLTVTNTEFTNNTAATGAAMTNRGTLVAENVTVHGNSVTEGGAAFANFADVFTLRNSRIYGNHAVGGGGAILNGANFIVEDSIIEENDAEYGGAVAGAGTVTLVRTELRNNSAWRQGGAIHTWESNVAVVDSTVSGNSSGDGGAIHIGKGGVDVSGSVFANNSSPACSGMPVNWQSGNDSDEPTCPRATE